MVAVFQFNSFICQIFFLHYLQYLYKHFCKAIIPNHTKTHALLFYLFLILTDLNSLVYLFLPLFYSFQLLPSKHSSWWRRLKTSWRHLSFSSSEDIFKTNIDALLIRLKKTSSWRLDQDQYFRLGHTSSRRLQDVFKMSSRRLQDVLQKCLQDIFKTSSRHLRDVLPRRLQGFFKTSSKRLAKMSLKHLQDVFKTSSRHLQDVFQRCLQDVFKT